MLMSRHLRTTAAVAALVLSLAACGASQDDSPTAGDDGAEVTESAQDAPEESADDASEADSDSAPADDSQDESEESEGEDGDATGQEAGSLRITLDGEDTVLTPEIVRCNGEPGTIRNAVITMKDDELPLVKITPGEFAMVKLDNHGEPEKSSSTTDITAEDGQITFDGAEIGGATVDGTVDCLQGNQG